MRKLFLFIALALTFATNAQTVIEKSGIYNSNEVWDADTVKITGSVTLWGDLTIEPGTYIEFQGLYNLTAWANIFASGTPENRITITAKDTNLTTNTGGIGVIGLQSIGNTFHFVNCDFIYFNSWAGILSVVSVDDEYIVSNCTFSKANPSKSITILKSQTSNTFVD
ncbi:MAG: hypothetical protein JEZ09_06670 [Salinivirgaceae bacterium]|nr:hypothetical protein [Salinivirgaceae bacterium]